LYFKVPTHTLTLEAFVNLFKKSCTAYTTKQMDGEIPEIEIDTIFPQSTYYFEPLLERATVPACQLLRPTRVKYLHIKFGQMNYNEVFLNAEGKLQQEKVQIPDVDYSTDKIDQMGLLQRLHLLEFMSQVELAPAMRFMGDFNILHDTADSWFYIVIQTMAKLKDRSVFLRKEDLEKLVLQFCALGGTGNDVFTQDSDQATISVDSVGLASLFHCALWHVGCLNKACGSPFPAYKEWELFDGNIFGLPVDAIRRLKSFSEGKYNKMMTMIEQSLPENCFSNDHPRAAAVQPFHRTRKMRPLQGYVATGSPVTQSYQQVAPPAAFPQAPFAPAKRALAQPFIPTPQQQFPVQAAVPAPKKVTPLPQAATVKPNNNQGTSIASAMNRKQAAATCVTAAQLEKQLGAVDATSSSPSTGVTVASMFKLNRESGGVRNVIDLVRLPDRSARSNLERWQNMGNAAAKSNAEGKRLLASGENGITLKNLMELVGPDNDEDSKKQRKQGGGSRWVPAKGSEPETTPTHAA
jgi:hypothetical protein